MSITMVQGDAKETAGRSFRRILALDGGGARGAIALAFLERIEKVLADRAPPTAAAPRLCDGFDLIGGTSTGAIIGTALALGRSAAEIRKFYFELAPRVFRRSLFRLRLFQPLFDARALQEEIARLIGDRRLDTPDLSEQCRDRHEADGYGRLLDRHQQSAFQILERSSRPLLCRQPPLSARRSRPRFGGGPIFFRSAGDRDRARGEAGPLRGRRDHAAQQSGARAAAGGDDTGLRLRLAARCRAAARRFGRDRQSPRHVEPRERPTHAGRRSCRAGAEEHGEGFRRSKC